MKRTLLAITSIATLTLTFAFYLTGAAVVNLADPETLNILARQATSNDPAKSADSITQLRTAGPAGLDAMFRVYQERITQQQEGVAPKDGKDVNWDQLRTALDTVGQQRDSYASHLYWYTNLEQAKAAAHASVKPILSLRLLGKLNEEFSCANSRFFRTTLYPNVEVSSYLRAHFILHWQSVRPVPHITIDMGDGRRIERTITGNSIHYVLDADGNPIDALPGLYGAKTFLAELNRAFNAEQEASKLSGAERAAFLRNYHSTRLAEIQHEWSSDLVNIGSVYTSANRSSINSSSRAPDAIAAAPVAATKFRAEVPLLRSGAQDALAMDRDRLDAMSTDAVWQKIAALHNDDAKLDAAATRLIQYKQPPTAAQATRITLSKRALENPMVTMIRNLQRSIAEDTVRNEYQLHSRIHEWFANGTAPTNLDALNSKVYAELFLTPSSDPWLGLVPANVFSALDDGGLVQTKTP